MRKWFVSRSSRLLPDTLPALQGGWLKAYTALWIALAAIAVVMTGLNAWKGFEPFEYTFGHYGLSGSEGDRIGVVTGSEAAAKGFRSGDAILAIDGVPIEQIGTGYLPVRKALIKEEGETVAFTVRSADGNVRTERLTRLEENTRRIEAGRKLSLGLALASAVAFLCAAILLFRRRREPVPAILALAFTMVLMVPNYAVDVWLDRASLTAVLRSGSTVGPALFMLGLVAFPDGRMSRIAWAFAFVIFLWCTIPLLFPGPVQVGMVDFGGTILLAGAVIRLFVRYRRLPDGITRQQVRWSIFGFALGAVLIAISTGLGFVARQIGGPTVFTLLNISNVAGSLSLVCFAAGLVVSLMRYRLYDADTVIGRSAAYGVLTLGFVALFAGSQKVIEALGETYFGGQMGALAGAMGAAVAATLIVPVHRKVNNWAERRFQKELLRLRKGLPPLVADLRETAPPNQIADMAAQAAMSGVQATRAAVLFGDVIIAVRGVSPERATDWLAERNIETESFEEARRDPLFPMRLALEAEGSGRVGWLVLGTRPDGSFFGKDDLEALAEIAAPVARALVISDIRERGKSLLRATFEQIERRFQALERGLSKQARAGSASVINS